mgnify:CR=1 FL=1
MRVVEMHDARTREPLEREAFVDVKLPELPKDASCGRAQRAYADEWRIGDHTGKPDLTNGQFGTVLGRGHYFDGCRVPRTVEVRICAAVQDGEVKGATVSTSPRAPQLERCIDRGVRALSFPAHPRMDVTQTVFTASR